MIEEIDWTIDADAKKSSTQLLSCKFMEISARKMPVWHPDSLEPLAVAARAGLAYTNVRVKTTELQDFSTWCIDNGFSAFLMAASGANFPGSFADINTIRIHRPCGDSSLKRYQAFEIDGVEYAVAGIGWFSNVDQIIK